MFEELAPDGATIKRYSNRNDDTTTKKSYVG